MLVGRQMSGGRGAMTICLAKKASCGLSSPASLEALHRRWRSHGLPRPGAGCSGQRCRTGCGVPALPGAPAGSAPAPAALGACGILLLSAAASPCHFPNSLERQPFITGVLYSDRSVSIHAITYQASEWKTRVDSFMGRCPLTSCFIQ